MLMHRRLRLRADYREQIRCCQMGAQVGEREKGDMGGGGACKCSGRAETAGEAGRMRGLCWPEPVFGTLNPLAWSGGMEAGCPAL